MHSFIYSSIHARAFVDGRIILPLSQEGQSLACYQNLPNAPEQWGRTREQSFMISADTWTLRIDKSAATFGSIFNML